MEYQWKGGFPNRGMDATYVGSHCEKLRESNGGSVTPRVVVDDAESDQSPLHTLFEWDNVKAADEFRLEQARNLLRSLTVIIPERPSHPVRAFVNIRQESPSGETESAYTSIEVALRNPAMRNQLLADATNELAAWRQRYRELEEFSRLFAEIDNQLRLIA